MFSVSLLLEAGADVNQWNEQNDLLCLASREGHYQCLNLLIQAMGDDAKARRMPLHAAAAQDHVKCVSLLINAGADVNSQNVYSQTALIRGVQNDHVRCASVLIKAGADVNHIDYFSSVLGYARSLEVTRVLLRSGVEINRSFFGWSKDKRAQELLLAAGETRFIDHCSDEVLQSNGLMGMCREAIREHLLKMDRYTHLFSRVERLGLPTVLVRYLVFDQSLDDDDDDNSPNIVDADNEEAGVG